MTTQQTGEERWRAEIEKRHEQGQRLEFTLVDFAAAVGEACASVALQAWLDGLVVQHGLRSITAYRCPIPRCLRVLPPGSMLTQCPFCGEDYDASGVSVTTEQHYRIEGEYSRDIRWMVVIHGMNSRAPWQEEFSWQIANRLKYSAPVLIYKYGWATIDVLVLRYHKVLARQLGQRLRIAIGQARKSHLPERPDILAHSFGTRLFSLVLSDPDFEDLSFGRVITAGSIVRPDYNWDHYVETGRVEAVLNHVAAKDMAVPNAQFTIPGTGPGGKVGYFAKSTLNVGNATFGHSSFFEPQTMRELIGEGGLWHNFLTRPLMSFNPENRFEADRSWRPASWLLRLLTLTLGHVLFGCFYLFSMLRRKLDP